MADTRTLTRVLLQVERAEGKAVLVGDPAQLPAVGPGGLFSAIVERNGAIELHDNRRQRDELERRALALLRDGRSRDYLAHAAQHGRLTVAADRVEAKAQLVADWWQAARGDLAGSAMIAYRRADVAELNTVARTLLDREGRLGRDRLRLDNGTELAAGDRILCTRNDRRLDDRQRQPRHHHRRRPRAAGGRGRARRPPPAHPPRPLPRRRPRRARLRAHRPQDPGAHARARVRARRRPPRAREWGYVALSRAREQTRLYTTATELEPDAPPHRPEPDGPVDRLADALTRPAAETLALDAATTRPDPTERAALARQTRQLREQRLALEKERLDTTRQLHQTNRTLAGLGVLGRARHGRALRDEIGEHEQTLARLDRELARLDRELRVTRERAFELARARPRLERGLTREPTLERGLGRERGLEPRDRAVSHRVDAEAALEPERPLHPDLDLHDPPQLPRPLDLQLPQPLRLTAGLAPELVRERSRHPRQISDRGHPRPQPRPDVLLRSPRAAGHRTPAASPPARQPRSTHPSRCAAAAPARREATPRRRPGAAGRRASPPAHRAPAASRSTFSERNEGQMSTPLVTSSVPRITLASPPINT